MCDFIAVMSKKHEALLWVIDFNCDGFAVLQWTFILLSQQHNVIFETPLETLNSGLMKILCLQRMKIIVIVSSGTNYTGIIYKKRFIFDKMIPHILSSYQYLKI